MIAHTWRILVVFAAFNLLLSLCIFDDADADFVPPAHFGDAAVSHYKLSSEEAFQLGRRLFYDPTLSGSNLVSCASCHIQRLAFTDGVAKSTGSYGMALEFNSMSLANLSWGNQRFFWNGRATSLEQQALAALISIEEMDQDLVELVRELKSMPDYDRLFQRVYGELTPRAIASGLSSFMRQLVSYQSKYDSFLLGQTRLSQQEEFGRQLFFAESNAMVDNRGGGCASCHHLVPRSADTDALEGFRNNGLDDGDSLPKGLMETTGQAQHKGLFKTPTLRNIAVTAPYMHDGRFETLREVVEHYNEGVKASPTLDSFLQGNTDVQSGIIQPAKLGLRDKDLEALVAFLKTLTDKDFLTNPRFFDPFASED